MADTPRTRLKTTGGGNCTLVSDISAGAVVTTNGQYFDMNISSALGALITGKAGATVTISQEQNSPALTTWLETRITSAPDSTDNTYYEDGEVSASGSSSLPKLFFATVGGTVSGKRQIWYGCAEISIGDLTLEKGKNSTREIKLTTVEWTGDADLTIPPEFWPLLTNGEKGYVFLDTTTPEPVLPTKLAKGKASVETWLKAKTA